MEVFSPINIYGALVLAVMMGFYAFEGRDPRYTLYFAITCVFSSAYGFLSGAWPFGVIEIVWTAISLRRYFNVKKQGKTQAPA